MSVLPVALHFDDVEPQPLREGHFVSREVALFDPGLGREYGEINRVTVRVSVVTDVEGLKNRVFTELYSVKWTDGRITHGHPIECLTIERWTPEDIAEAHERAEQYQKNITWE